MKQPRQKKAKTDTSGLLPDRAELLRLELQSRFTLFDPALTSITAAERAGLKRDALRNFTDRNRHTTEPGVFKIADVAALLGCTIDDLLAKGNALRDKQFPELFTVLPNRIDTTAKQTAGSTTGEERMTNDHALRYIVQSWGSMSDSQRIELLRKVFEISQDDEARFLAG